MMSDIILNLWYVKLVQFTHSITFKTTSRDNMDSLSQIKYRTMCVHTIINKLGVPPILSNFARHAWLWQRETETMLVN